MKTQKNVAVGDRPTNEELVQRLQGGDPSAAEELLRQNSGYLTVLAKQYDKTARGPSLEEDLKQEGAMALLKAAEQFDPTLGNRFLTYATPAIQAAMRDCAARSALPLTIPTGRYHQLRQVLWHMAENEKASDAELLSHIVEKLQVSEPVARSLLLESRTLFQSYDLGDQVFTVSCGGDPAKAYDRQMQRRLLFRRIEEVLSPRELNLVRCHLGIGQPEEQGMTFQELAIRLNYNGPSGAEKAYKSAIRKLKRHLHGGAYGRWLDIQRKIQDARREADRETGHCSPWATWLEEQELIRGFLCKTATLCRVYQILRTAGEEDREG